MKTMKKLKVVGNYAKAGTQIIDTETGIPIPNVKRIVWIHEAGNLPRCCVELVGVTCESEADVIDVTSMESGSMFREFMTVKEVRKRDGLN
jgi:hypothetical protein